MYPIQNTRVVIVCLCPDHTTLLKNRLSHPWIFHVLHMNPVVSVSWFIIGTFLQNIVIMNEMHCISGKIQLLFKRILPRVQAALSIPYFRMSWLMWTHISLLQDFMRLGGKTFCGLFHRSPAYMCEIIHPINVIHTQETPAFGQCHIWYIAVFVEGLLSVSNLFRLPKAYDWDSWTPNLLRNWILWNRYLNSLWLHYSYYLALNQHFCGER